MIRELLAEGKTEAEVRAVLVANLPTDALTAQFMIDLELGRQEGDVLLEDNAGNERPAPPGALLKV